MPETSGLLDRDSELARSAHVLDEVRDRGGRVLIVRGPPGIGKSRLLSGVQDLAGRAGFACRIARCGEFERDLSFGVARQLLGPQADGAAALSEPLGREPVTDFQACHALYWACADASSWQPMVLVVDDAQWADSASLGWLRYLARRLADVRVLLLLAVRSDDVSSAHGALLDIASAASATEISLGPLSEAATGRILHDVTQQPVETAFRDTCHRVTGGNPFLVTELARAMRDQGIPPHDAELWQIGSLRPQSIVRSIQSRLARLPSTAQSLAEAAAIFGVEAQFRHAAMLASLAPNDAVAAADALHRAWIVSAVDPLRFEHALTRDAVLAELPPARLARDHKRAADVLAGEGAEAERVASHLLLATPVGDPATARWLAAAAEPALRRGAPASATTYLERALLEPPPVADRWALRWMLGRAEGLLGRSAATENLQVAWDACPDPARRAEIAADLAAALTMAGRVGEAYERLEEAIVATAPHDRDAALRLECRLLSTAQLDHGLAARVRPRVEALATAGGGTPAGRAAMAMVAYARLNDDTPYDEVLRAAEIAFGDGAILTDPLVDDVPLGFLSRVFTNLGLIEPGALLMSRCVSHAQRHGSLAGFVFAAMSRAALSLALGDLEAAADDADAAAAALEGSGLLAPTAAVAALRVAVDVERGELDRPLALLEGMGLLGAVPPFGVLDQLLYHRGLLHAARGDLDAAVDDLLELGRRQDVAGHHVVVTQWRCAAAPLLAALGREDHARELATHELALTRRRGISRPLALALRATAAVEGDDLGSALLAESVELLTDSPFRLELAHSEVALGAALRRRNRRADARLHLERGLDLAFRCGADALAARARSELAATGARPRRLVLTGPEALTGSERRVAELAAAGHSNPEIARLLFVSRKTVETHLGRVFQKIGVSDRSRITTVLSRQATEPRDSGLGGVR